MKKVEKEIRERDEQDSLRELAPLRPAADARHIDSTGISAEEVVERILAVVEKASRLQVKPPQPSPLPRKRGRGRG
jgi:cytidylate kinase